MSTKTSVLKDLIQTLEDGRLGFEKGAEKLTADGDQSGAQTFRNLSEQRARFSAELRDLARAGGDDLDQGGSIAGSLHRGWLTLKDAISGDNPSGVLDAAEQGEDHAKSEYQKALADDGLAGDARTVVERQYQAVAAAHDQVRAMRDAA